MTFEFSEFEKNTFSSYDILNWNVKQSKAFYAKMDLLWTWLEK